MYTLVTGHAGFIGSHLVHALINAGKKVIAVDSLSDYYDRQLKLDRLATLETTYSPDVFQSYQFNLTDQAKLNDLFKKSSIDTVVHLAAQAGVRCSLTNPHEYAQSNIVAFLNILEACRHNGVSNLLYASSSSVYGDTDKVPFSETDSANHPISLYAASKRSNELMAHSYSHLFGLPTTGLRFFTVYGPWNRPDMAMFLFANGILNREPLKIFNDGNLHRDFTYVSDIVEGIVRLCDSPAERDPSWTSKEVNQATSRAPWEIYNIGNNHPILVKDLVSILETQLGIKAILESRPMQAGDVHTTYASVDRLANRIHFQPKTPIEVGVKLFLDWLIPYRDRRLKNGTWVFGRNH
jgi:UDP-glucuronate 4-epimerase